MTQSAQLADTISEIESLEKPRVLEIVNELKINPIVKSVMLAQLRRADEDSIKKLLGKVSEMAHIINGGDADKIIALKDEMIAQAGKAHIPPAYILQLFELLKQ